jgi:hypothetical protein
MGDIRPLERSELAEVVGLHERIARSRGETVPPGLERHFARLFFDYPCADPELPPLAYVDEDGTIAGFLGSSVRPFLWEGTPVRMRISSHLLTEPRARKLAAGAQLLRTFLAGPQDFSVTDTANEASRRMWEGLGGATAHLNGVAWVRPLRPWRFGRAFLAWRHRRGLAAAARPLARPLDFLTLNAAARGLRPPRTAAESADLSVADLVEHGNAVTSPYALRPDYASNEFVTWLFGALREVWGAENLVARIVRRDGRVRGWYVYSLKPGGVGAVLQLVAVDRDVDDVLDALVADAFSRGAVGLHGRAEAHVLEPLSNRPCLFYPSGSRVLVHARDPGLTAAIHSGRALLTRVDADWWIYGAWWDATVGTTTGAPA